MFIEAVKKYVGFKVLTVVAMKSSIFWNITLCPLMEDNLLCTSGG
jgi:hypothetical protein